MLKSTLWHSGKQSHNIPSSLSLKYLLPIGGFSKFKIPDGGKKNKSDFISFKKKNCFNYYRNLPGKLVQLYYIL